MNVKSCSDDEVAWVDSGLVITAETAYVSPGTGAVLFSRSAGSARFLSFEAAAPALRAGSTIVSDEFDGANGLDLMTHTPDMASEGSMWEVEHGTWEIRWGAVRERSTVPMPYSYDYRVVIDAGTTDAIVSAMIKRQKDDQIFGVLGRHEGMYGAYSYCCTQLFFDGACDLVLTVNREGTGFQELGRAAFSWAKGEQHTLALEMRCGYLYRIVAGDVLLSGYDDNPLGDSGAGLFLRGQGSTSFLSFSATEGSGG